MMPFDNITPANEHVQPEINTTNIPQPSNRNAKLWLNDHYQTLAEEVSLLGTTTKNNDESHKKKIYCLKSSNLKWLNYVDCDFGNLGE